VKRLAAVPPALIQTFKIIVCYYFILNNPFSAQGLSVRQRINKINFLLNNCQIIFKNFCWLGKDIALRGIISSHEK